MITNVNEFAASTLSASRPTAAASQDRASTKNTIMAAAATQPAGPALGRQPTARPTPMTSAVATRLRARLGHDVADQDQRAADRHGPEPVHDAVAHVGGHRDGGGARAEPGAQHDEAGDHIVDVGAAATEGARRTRTRNSSISTTGSISAVKNASGSRSDRRTQRVTITRESVSA